MKEDKIALKVNDLDNVATIFANGILRGSIVELQDGKGRLGQIEVLNDVPYGHKIAVREIVLGEQIIKYGEEIGVATHSIARGEYVHIHNLDSMRGRGDLKQEGTK